MFSHYCYLTSSHWCDKVISFFALVRFLIYDTDVAFQLLGFYSVSLIRITSFILPTSGEISSPLVANVLILGKKCETAILSVIFIRFLTAFRDYLTQHGVFTTIRASRGQDIYAACGLLSTARKEQETI